MTNEEALERLKTIPDEMRQQDMNNADIEAVKIAIEALKQVVEWS